MKIIHIIWGLNYGGIETMLINIANQQAILGHEVNIVVINDVVETNIINSLSSSVRLYRLNRKTKSRSFLFIIKLNNLLRSICPDILHLHSAFLYYMIYPQWRGRMCCTMHDIPFDKRTKQGRLLLPNLGIMNLFIKQATNIQNLHRFRYLFAISKSVQDELLNSFGIKSILVNNGINVEKFRAREEDLFHNNHIRIIQVSRLDHNKKGQDLLIEAIAKLKSKINMTVDFIGEGPSLCYLKHLSEEKNVQDIVNFLGAKSPDYISDNLLKYDLFIQPSRIEGFGLTVAEAIAAKVPVLVSSGEGPAEITCNDTYGWTFKKGDSTSLSNMIEYIYNHKEDVVYKTNEALRYIQSNYSVSSTAKNYINGYNNVLNSI
ncbi:MAG: glycosyltransferase family 4 protein [Rikenellaceae bacterium]